jgi:hypothetical protein
MSRQELEQLLALIEDTHEIVLRRLPGPPMEPADELFAIWSAARADANLAYDEWRLRPGAEHYAAYRAAEDRADAAEDALAALKA